MKIGPLTIAVMAISLASSGQATTIFSHTFGGGTTDLNGAAVDTGSGNWIASSNFDRNGNVNATDAAAGSATLAFTPVNGLVYTLDATFGSLTSVGNENWLALGFAFGQSAISGSNSRFINNNVIGRVWSFNRGSGATANNNAFLGSGGSGTTDGVAWTTDAGVFGGNMTLRIVLDTTGGTGNWTATWFTDTGSGFNQVRATTTLLDENINSVGFAVANTTPTGSITSFSLSSIPEPSSLALFGLGGLFLLRRRRSIAS